MPFTSRNAHSPSMAECKNGSSGYGIPTKAVIFFGGVDRRIHMKVTPETPARNNLHPNQRRNLQMSFCICMHEGLLTCVCVQRSPKLPYEISLRQRPRASTLNMVPLHVIIKGIQDIHRCMSIIYVHVLVSRDRGHGGFCGLGWERSGSFNCRLRARISLLLERLLALDHKVAGDLGGRDGEELRIQGTEVPWIRQG